MRKVDRVSVVASVCQICQWAVAHLRGARKCRLDGDWDTAARMDAAFRAYRLAAYMAAAPLREVLR